MKIIVRTAAGQLVDRLSPWATYVKQPPKEANQGVNYKQYVWSPPPSEAYQFQHKRPVKPRSLKIYESHVGIATQNCEIGSYRNFADNVLPRIKRQGYNAVQVMAVMEHAYYASFGYQVGRPSVVFFSGSMKQHLHHKGCFIYFWPDNAESC